MTILRVRTVFTGPPGAPWLGTAYFNGVDAVDAAAAVTAIGDFWAAVDNELDDSVAWATDSEVLAVNEVNGEATGSFGTTPRTGNGVATGERAPTLIQALIRLRTGSFSDGREVRGRWFIPGLSEAVLADGVLNSGTTAAFQTAIDTLINISPTSLTVWRRPRPEEDPPDPNKPARVGSTHPVTSGQAINRLSPLRSRRD